MSVATLNETRTYGRILTMTKDAIVPGIKQNAYDLSPLMAALLGRLTDAQFGPVRLNGRGMKMQSGGASVEVYHELGKNTTAKTLPGPWGTVDTAPQDNVRHSRANWTHYVAAATISNFETLINKGDLAIANTVQFEVGSAVRSLVDLVADHLYDNSGNAERVTSISQIAAASDTLQGLDGDTYTRWNSRGVSARGTAPNAVSFASGSFPTQGIRDMRTAWSNCTEGAYMPQALYTTHAVYNLYEAQLQSQERFTNASVADAGFANLAFKSAPVFADSKCPTGSMFFWNFDAVYLKCLEGADFFVDEFNKATEQLSMTAPVIFNGQLVCENRYLVNKLVSITA